MGKIEDIEPRLHDVCPVTGLSVLRKPEWTDVDFENVSDYIYVHDLEGNFTEADLVWKKELGLTEGDLAHLNVRDLIPQRFEHQFDDYLDRVKAKGKDDHK